MCFIAIHSFENEKVESNNNIATNEKENNSFETDMEKKKKHKKFKTHNKMKTRTWIDSVVPTPAPQNQSFVNNTIASMWGVSDIQSMKSWNRVWDYKLLDKEVEDIFLTMNLKSTPWSRSLFWDRAYVAIFMKSFANCNKNWDNQL